MKSKLTIAILATSLAACSMSEQETAALQRGYAKLWPETATLTREEFVVMYDNGQLPGQACAQIVKDAKSAAANSAAAAAMSGAAVGLAAGRK